MRELDLLLEKFLSSDFDSLAEVELVSLERLLDHPDQDILAWLTASREPPRKLGPIVWRIRRCLNS
jgi:succinate dehydrogenase flavin-adding protein (antitoxin of CptAB toxin-antitoxin module)